MVKNEVDVIEAFVRHTAALVDHHIIVDHASIDGTDLILKALADEGLPLTLRRYASPDFPQGSLTTKMARMAQKRFGADWVFPLDADEFLVVAPGHSLKELLASETGPVEVLQRTYVPTAEDSGDEENVALRITQRLVDEPVPIPKVLVPQALVREATIMEGNHRIAISGKQQASTYIADMWLAHVPVRSPEQMAAKVVVGSLALEALGRRRGSGIHYREAFESLKAGWPAFLGAFDHEIGRHNPGAGGNTSSDLVHDPIPYDGGPLQHSTVGTGEPWHSILVQAESIASGYGSMTEELRILRRVVAEENPGIGPKTKRPRAALLPWERRPRSGVPVVAVVLNHESSADTLRCVERVGASRYADLTTIVVDNGSSAADRKALASSLLGEVELIETESNLGYAGGNNVGIREARRRGAAFTWILNPDTLVEEDTLERLLATADRFPDAGIFGPRLYEPGPPPRRIAAGGGSVNWRRCGITKHIDFGELETVAIATEPYVVDYVVGAAMLVRSGVFDGIGLLPEEYFLYFEETEFCLSAAKVGWMSMVDPLAAAVHPSRVLDAAPPPHLVYYFLRNSVAFGLRHTDCSADRILTRTSGRIERWRAKVVDQHGSGAEYDALVERAMADGIAQRLGPRRDVTTSWRQVAGR